MLDGASVDFLGRSPLEILDTPVLPNKGRTEGTVDFLGRSPLEILDTPLLPIKGSNEGTVDFWER